MDFPWIAESEFVMLARQGYSLKALADLAGADCHDDGSADCPECGAPDFCCMGEHDTTETRGETQPTGGDDA